MISTVPVPACVAMEPRVAVKAAVAAESAITVEPAVAPEALIPAKSLVPVKVAASAEFAVPLVSAEPFSSAEAAVTIAASETAVSVKIPALVPAKVSPPFTTVKIAMVVAAKSSPAVSSAEFAMVVATEPSPAAISFTVIAPAISIAEMPPSVIVVEVTPARIIEIEIAAIKRRSVEAVKPRTRSDEHAARKPLRPVITIGSAVIRRIRIIAIGAHRRRSNVHRSHIRRGYPYANRHAHVRACRPRREARKSNGNSCYCGVLQKASHLLTSLTGWVCSCHTDVHMARPVPNSSGARSLT